MRRSARRADAGRGVLALVLTLAAFAAAVPAAHAQASRTTAAAPSPQVARIRTITDREARRDTTDLGRWLHEDGSAAARAAAAVALGRIQNRGSVPALARALDDRVADVRREAAFALGLVGDSTAAPALERRLAVETEPRTRDALIAALGMAGDKTAGPSLARSLRAKRPGERGAAALAAARLRDSTLVATLVGATKDASPEVRWRVAYALGRIGDPAGAPALRTLSSDKIEIVRAMAARGLGDVGDSTAGPRLVSLLGDTAWRVRVNAAHALGALHARRDARSLVPLLRDPQPHVRWEAAASLGLVGDSTAISRLQAALDDSATGVIHAAAISMLQIYGERAIPAIAPAIDLLPGYLRSSLVEALGPVSGPLALETLLARARDSTDAPQAAGAASGLAKRPADAAASIPVLRGLLGSRDFTVVCSAAEALGTLGDSASVPALAGLLQRSGNPEASDVRTSAATALASLKTGPALDALRPARSDPERRVREIATTALGLPPDSIAAEPAPQLRVDPIPNQPAVSATVETSRGTVRIVFDPKAAPRTVENFARLARSGYFDGLVFHRVVPNFVVQDGCPRGDGWGGPGYAIPCEYNALPYETGTVGMALSGKDTGGSQWFITLSPQPRLEGRYTVFGKVATGLDVVERLMPGDRILKISIR
jgi:HEAT repeat protein/cyclophilin family peptidyl-prolyl cis-trans isomerase